MAQNYPINYLIREAPAIEEALKAAVPFFTDEWTDLSDTDPGWVIVKLFAMVADTMHYYIDRAASEVYSGTAIEIQSVTDILKKIGYQLEWHQSARGEVTIARNSSVGEVSIREGHRLASGSNRSIEFYVATQNAKFEEGISSIVVPIIQGKVVYDDIGISDGTYYQKFKSSYTRLSDGLHRVYVDNIEWTIVPSFAGYGPEDDVCIITRDGEGYITVEFGDGARGKIPTLGSPILYRGIISDGSSGNAGVGDVSVNIDPVNNYVITVYNDEAVSGGADPENIATAKQKAPLWFATQSRAVTENDYGAWAYLVSNVAKAKAVARTLNIIQVYIVPDGGGQANDELIKSVNDTLALYRMATDIVIVKPVHYIYVTGKMTIVLFDGTNRQNIINVLEDKGGFIDIFFSVDANSIGVTGKRDGNIILSDFIGALERIPGINYIQMEKFTMRPDVQKGLWNSDATVVGITTTKLTNAQTWTIQFLNGRDFVVFSDFYPNRQRGKVDTLFTDINNEISFTVQSGVYKPLPGDKVTIRVSKDVYDIEINNGEFPALDRFDVTYKGGII